MINQIAHFSITQKKTCNHREQPWQARYHKKTHKKTPGRSNLYSYGRMICRCFPRLLNRSRTLCILQVDKREKFAWVLWQVPVNMKRTPISDSQLFALSITHCQNTHTVHKINLLFYLIPMDELIFYLRQVFHLLYDNSIPFGGGLTLLFLNIIDSCVIR